MKKRVEIRNWHSTIMGRLVKLRVSEVVRSTKVDKLNSLLTSRVTDVLDCFVTSIRSSRTLPR